MKLIRGMLNLKSQHGPSVVTIGNFDGIHRGHQQLLRQLCMAAKQVQLPATVIIFEPQPNEFFAEHATVARLTRLREKIGLLKEAGVDQILVLRFNDKLAALSPEQFVEEILVKGLRAHTVLLGDDFRFGYRRQGTFALLQEIGTHAGFVVERINSVQQQGERVSSTAVRQALAVGDLARAQSLLAHPYSLCGRVAHGDKRGRIIGFPTANVHLHRKLTPLTGVYCVKVYGLEPEVVYGVANVGNRPTVDGTRTLLEVHLFNFQQEIYGRAIRVEFMHKLREEKRYDSFELLKQQIFLDAEQAKIFFGIGDHERL
jgi:riboflavin kinase/FMN adenylyltransferase